MPPVRNAWYVAAWGHKVGAEPLARSLLGDEAVALARRALRRLSAAAPRSAAG